MKFNVMGAVILGSLWLGGCATEDYVNKHIEPVQGEVTTLQGQVRDHDSRLGAHDAHLAQLDQNVKEALDRAEAANKLAEGKFLYSVVVSDDSTKFKVGHSELSDDAKAKLTDTANRLKTDNKNVYLEIQGYTDNSGSKAENLRLGQERAEAVRRFLNTQGVALNRMATISYGSDNPVASNHNRKGRAQNRRVVVVVLN